MSHVQMDGVIVHVHAALVRSLHMKTDQRSTVMSSGGRFGRLGQASPQNLQWAASVLRAKDGIMSSQPMAIAKKVAQKARSKIKRKHGTVPAPSVELQMQLQSISAERAARQLHHLVKQLVQAAKKARTFLVRRQLRKANQTASAPTADERIVALKAVAPAAVARRALDQVGLTEQRVPMGADAQSAARQAETAIRPGLLEECEWRLLATAQVQAQVEGCGSTPQSSRACGTSTKRPRDSRRLSQLLQLLRLPTLVERPHTRTPRRSASGLHPAASLAPMTTYRRTRPGAVLAMGQSEGRRARRPPEQGISSEQPLCGLALPSKR